MGGERELNSHNKHATRKRSEQHQEGTRPGGKRREQSKDVRATKQEQSENSATVAASDHNCKALWAYLCQVCSTPRSTPDISQKTVRPSKAIRVVKSEQKLVHRGGQFSEYPMQVNSWVPWVPFLFNLADFCRTSENMCVNFLRQTAIHKLNRHWASNPVLLDLQVPLSLRSTLCHSKRALRASASPMKHQQVRK